MTRLFILGSLLLICSALFLLPGCDKEKIVTSTEIIREVEYIESPPDTIFQIDSVFVSDSVTIYQTDTLFINDTIERVEFVHDTVTTIEYVYDTIMTTDTVTLNQNSPNEYLALAALQYYTDPLVITMVTLQFGITEGWIFYLSAFQSSMTQQANDTYDIYGYIDFNTIDWYEAYLIEYLWRMKYTGGDPADPTNWHMSEPPAVSNNFQPGLTFNKDRVAIQPDN